MNRVFINLSNRVFNEVILELFNSLTAVLNFKTNLLTFNSFVHINFSKDSLFF